MLIHRNNNFFFFVTDDIVPVRMTPNVENNTIPSHRNKRSLNNLKVFADENLRSKRSISSEFFVEMMVVADRSMAEYHGDFLEIYIYSLMYIVSMSYNIFL